MTVFILQTSLLSHFPIHTVGGIFSGENQYSCGEVFGQKKRKILLKTLVQTATVLVQVQRIFSMPTHLYQKDDDDGGGVVLEEKHECNTISKKLLAITLSHKQPVVGK